MTLSLSKIQLAIAATIVLLLVALTPTPVAGHSYVDCVDWRFKNPKNKSWADDNGSCHGFARQFPVGARPFASLDSDWKNRHYQQEHNNPNALSCSDGIHGATPGSNETMTHPVSAAYSSVDFRGRKTGVMTVAKPGQQLCVRWPAKNHGTPTSVSHAVTIALSAKNPKVDPTQPQFNKLVIKKLSYRNCTPAANTDIQPCGGCFNMPAGLAAGMYVMQWRWQLNAGEFYTSCSDIKVV